jgi:PAS domain S-box-containing protein
MPAYTGKGSKNRPVSARDLRFWTSGIERILRSPLIRKIAMIIFLVILLAEIVIFVPSFFNKREELTHRLIDSAIQTLQLTRDLLDIGTTPHEISQALLRHPEVAGVALLDGTGKISRTYGEPPVTDWSAPGARGNPYETHQHIGERRVEIFVEAGRFGMSQPITVRLDANHIPGELTDFTINIGILVVLLTAVLTLATMTGMLTTVLRPLLRLQRGLQSSENFRGDPRFARELSRKDEIGDVYRATVDLLDRVAEHNQFLEDRVTERTLELESTNAQLVRSEQRIRDYTAAISDFYFELSADLVLSFVSDRYTELTGIPTSEIVGRPRDALRLAQDADEWAPHLADLNAHKPFRNFVRTHIHPDGHKVHVAISGHPVFDEAEQFQGYRGAGADVTALIEAERALHESQQLLGAIIDHIPAPFTITLKDREGRYVLANRHFCERRGRSIDEVLGKTTDELYPPEVGAVILSQDQEILDTQKPAAYEFDSVGPDGSVDTFSTVRFPVLDSDGAVMGLGAVNLNISERKRFETELADAKLYAEQALADLTATQANLIEAEKLASLGQITAGIAHEIKNPLNFICNFSELSVELMSEFQDLSEQVRKHLHRDTQESFDDICTDLLGNLTKISEHGRRADDIVKGMLMHSRGEVGGAEFCEVVSVVEESVNLAWHGARAQNIGTEVKIERDYDPATGIAEISRQQISRVIINLVSNAHYAVRKRKETGEIGYVPVITIKTRDHGEAVELTVMDNGAGISAEAKTKLFQPFYTTKPPGEGTGLGLSLSYDIVVHQHGGGMHAESVIDEYSLFRVVLPRSRAPAKDEAK